MLTIAVACGSDGPGPTAGESSTSSTSTISNASTLVSVDEFADRIDDPGVVTINVHVPDEGNIAGTDLRIPYDEISESADLPTELDTPLAVYCRSGNMSATAVVDLSERGYTDVVELEGGFNAWADAGRPLEQV
jgi:rhodanese-related sulfurtransferase